MADRAHCKLLYDEDEDMHEYEPLHDFSVSYGDAQGGDLLRDDQDAVAAEEAGVGAEADETPEGDGVEPCRALGMTDIGELVLFDGKTVENRKWNRYYKQGLRTVDARKVAVAQRKASSLRMGAM